MIEWLVISLIGLLPILVTLNESAAGYVAFAWLLISVFFLLKKNSRSIDGSYVNIATISFAAYSFFNIAYFIFSHASARALDNTFLFILFIPVAIVISRLKTPYFYFWMGAVLCGLVAGGVSVYQKYGLRLDSATGFTNRNKFAYLSLANFFVIMSGLWLKDNFTGNKRTYVFLLTVCGMLGAMLAILLAQTRGAWLYSIILLAVWLCFSKTFSLKLKASVTLLIVCVLVGGYFSSATNMKERIDLALQQARTVSAGNDASDTSVGVRLEMWRVSFEIFRSHPWLGSGIGTYHKEVLEIVRNEKASKEIVQHKHPHNEYFYALATTGIFGLLVFVMAHVGVLLFFLKKMKSDFLEVRIPAWTGAMFIGSMMLFSLTDPLYYIRYSTIYFVVNIMVLVGFCLQKPQTLACPQNA